MEKNYDCIIIGGGYAGISAAIYLSRFTRSVLVFDTGKGRWNSNEINENYLGFPQGIASKDLRKLGVEQARRFGALFLNKEIISITKKENLFMCTSKQETFQSKTLILATGVRDNFPHFSNWKEYIGKSLFWCITCDGHKTINKKIVILGNTDDSACNAMQFLNFTKNITFITNKQTKHHTISNVWISRLQHANIPFYDEPIQKEFGHNGMFEKLTLQNGKEISFDYMFSEREPLPHSELAVMLGVSVDKKGYIFVDKDQRTNIQFVYAAGDITKEFTQQVASAVYEGSAAAETVNYDLYQPEQQEV